MRILVALLALVSSQAASAATIQYLEDFRVVHSSYYLFHEGKESEGTERLYSDGLAQSWSADLYHASLKSTLTPTAIAIELTASQWPDISITDEDGALVYLYFGQNWSLARIRFTVDEPTPSLWEREGVQQTRDLVPGVVYEINEQAIGEINSGPEYITLSVSMRLVPEPGTASLLALGLAVIARRRCSSRTQLATAGAVESLGA